MPSIQIPNVNNPSNPALSLSRPISATSETVPNLSASPPQQSLSKLPGREGNPSLIETHATSSAGTTLLESIHEMIVDNQLVINTFIAGELSFHNTAHILFGTTPNG